MGEEGEKGEGRRLIGELPETESLETGLSGCESGTSSSWLWSLDSLSSESAGFWKLRRVVLVYL